MNISGISGAVSAAATQASASPKSSQGTSVLKKALDTQAAGAAALIDSIPDIPQGGRVGSNLNVVA